MFLSPLRFHPQLSFQGTRFIAAGSDKQLFKTHWVEALQSKDGGWHSKERAKEQILGWHKTHVQVFEQSHRMKKRHCASGDQETESKSHVWVKDNYL